MANEEEQIKSEEYWKRKYELLEESVSHYCTEDMLKKIRLKAAGHAGGVAVKTPVEETAKEEVSKPEVTEDKIRIPIHDCKITATINISEKDGIKALYCGKEKMIATYLFDREKFTESEAKAWVKEHKPSEGMGKSVEIEYTVPIFKADEEKRLVYGVVLEPGVVDAQNDFETAEQIEQACHSFLINSRVIFKDHEQRKEDCHVVENYIAPVDYEQVKKGSWVMVTYCGDDEVWNAVKSGELTGYSIRGTAQRG